MNEHESNYINIMLDYKTVENLVLEEMKRMVNAEDKGETIIIHRNYKPPKVDCTPKITDEGKAIIKVLLQVLKHG